LNEEGQPSYHELFELDIFNVLKELKELQSGLSNPHSYSYLKIA
jgi:hypothetical protein